VDLKSLNDVQITRRYRRRFVFGVLLMIVLAFPAAIFSFSAIQGLFNRPSDWIPADMQVRVEFDDFSRRFSVADLVLVSWDSAKLGATDLTAATRLLQPLCEQVESQPIAGKPETPVPLSSDAINITSSLLSDLNAKPFHWVRNGTELLERMTGSPTNLPRALAIKRLTGSIVGPDGQQTCMVLSLTEAGLVNRRLVLAQIRSAIAKQVGIEGDKIAMAGSPFDGKVIDEASIRSVQTFSPPSAIVAAVLCFFCLRSFVLTASITAIAVIGEGLVLTAVHYSGSPMNAVLIVLPPLVFVLTVSSGIHLSNYYLDALGEYPSATPAQAAAIAMRAGTLPCLLAAATTVVGLGSLVLVRLAPIQLFGAVATMGLLFTLGLLLLVLPGAMTFYSGPRRVSDRDLLHGPKHTARSNWLMRRVRFVFRRLLDYPKTVIFFFGVAMVVIATGLFKLDTSVSVPRMFAATHPLRTQYDWFESKIGPTVNGELLLRFPGGNLESDVIDRLQLVRDAHLATAQTESVGGVLSAVSFLPAVPKGRGISATASRSVIRAQLVDPESAIGTLGYISRDEQAEVWRVSFRLPLTLRSDFEPDIQAVRTAVNNALSAALTKAGESSISRPEVVITGGVKIGQEAQVLLLHDLFTSFVSAFAVVAIVMMLLLRSIIGGLLAMLPNLFPTVWLFGYMGLIDMPLDIGSVMTASVALGIAVDDTIHLLSRFSSRTAKGIRTKKAAWGSLRQCGMAMVHTTLVCGLSLMVYSFSDFMPTRHFAFLMFGLLGIALVGDLVLLPALMVSPLSRFLARPALADPDSELSADEVDETQVDARRLPEFESGRP